MKPIYIVVAFGLVVVVFLAMSSKKVGAKTAQAAPGLNLGGFSLNFGGDDKPSAPASTPPQNNAASNYLADTTAASDNASGVVGFGGWD
jgi:hypothetical protein